MSEPSTRRRSHSRQHSHTALIQQQQQLCVFLFFSLILLSVFFWRFVSSFWVFVGCASSLTRTKKKREIFKKSYIFFVVLVSIDKKIVLKPTISTTYVKEVFLNGPHFFVSRINFDSSILYLFYVRSVQILTHQILKKYLSKKKEKVLTQCSEWKKFLSAKKVIFAGLT